MESIIFRLENAGLRIQGQHNGKGFNFLVNAKTRFGARQIIEAQLRPLGVTDVLGCFVSMTANMLQIKESDPT